jgi:hypothetical protein
MAMEIRSLSNGMDVEFDVRSTVHGYMIVHRVRGDEKYEVTCCCEGMGCVTATCSGEEWNATCNCTGSSPSITC